MVAAAATSRSMDTGLSLLLLLFLILISRIDGLIKVLIFGVICDFSVRKCRSIARLDELVWMTVGMILPNSSIGAMNIEEKHTRQQTRSRLGPCSTSQIHCRKNDRRHEAIQLALNGLPSI